jgi:hypothetical protein
MAYTHGLYHSQIGCPEKLPRLGKYEATDNSAHQRLIPLDGWIKLTL